MRITSAAVVLIVCSASLAAEEREADAFASELLVPRDKLREHLKNTTDVRELAGRFFVSQQVMRIAIDQSNRASGR